jgi:hypothetical protein
VTVLINLGPLAVMLAASFAAGFGACAWLAWKHRRALSQL